MLRAQRRDPAKAQAKCAFATNYPLANRQLRSHGKFVLIFVAGLRHSMMGHQLSLASLQGLGAGFGRYRAAL